VRVVVIGVGSRGGDDAAGLVAAECLSSGALPEGVSVALCERPFPDLLDQLAGAEAAVLLDAVRSGRPAGTVQRIDRDRIANPGASSSHGFGAARALDLYEAVAGPLARVEWVGIEAGSRLEGDPSEAVRAGAAEASRLVRALLASLVESARLAGGERRA
jgi:hydrogenase maturation protease